MWNGHAENCEFVWFARQCAACRHHVTQLIHVRRHLVASSTFNLTMTLAATIDKPPATSSVSTNAPGNSHSAIENKQPRCQPSANIMCSHPPSDTLHHATLTLTIHLKLAHWLLMPWQRSYQFSFSLPICIWIRSEYMRQRDGQDPQSSSVRWPNDKLQMHCG